MLSSRITSLLTIVLVGFANEATAGPRDDAYDSLRQGMAYGKRCFSLGKQLKSVASAEVTYATPIKRPSLAQGLVTVFADSVIGMAREPTSVSSLSVKSLPTFR